MSGHESLIAALSPEALCALPADDFREIVERMDDECIRRGWPCCPWEPPIHEHPEPIQ